MDAVADNYSMATLGHPKDVLLGLHGILSSSRGGNRTLLALLNSKLAAACPDLSLLAQPSTLATNEAILSTVLAEQPEAWDYMTSALGLAAPNQYDLEQMSELAWPPLDLGNLLRSPSPVTRMLLDQPPPVSPR